MKNDHNPAENPLPPAPGGAPGSSAVLPPAQPTGAAAVPPTRAALAHLLSGEVLSAPAWDEAVRYCGFVPGGEEWRAYLGHMCMLGGALFLLAGIIFFIASNWDAMHRFSRLGLMAALVGAPCLAAVRTGLDTLPGRILLLASGIAVGPALAVFGQTYQTGAQLWELFRIWAGMLLLLALAGKQAGLWFTAWIVGNLFVMFWMGRSMASPLHAVGIFSTLPEAVLALALALAVWEWAARGRGNETRNAWLRSRWLPRLLFFDLSVRLTAYLCLKILANSFQSLFVLRHGGVLLLPRQPLLEVTAAVVAAFSWYWYRKKTPDLFMPACVLAGGAAVLVALLLRAELFYDSGVSGVLAWGMLIVGLTAGVGKILLSVQERMDREAGTDREGPDRFAGPGTAVGAFLGRTGRTPSWEELWTHMKERCLVAGDAPLPVPPPAPSPWYVRALLAFGGWLAAVLLALFAGLLLFRTLRIRSGEGTALFSASLPFLLAAWFAMRGKGILARQFGLAVALAGAITGGAGIVAGLEAASASPLLVAVFLAVLAIPLRDGAFRFLVAAAVACLVPAGFMAMGTDAFGTWKPGPDASWSRHILHGGSTVWWAALAVAMAGFRARESRWRTSPLGDAAVPLGRGAYFGMMAALVLSLSMLFRPSFGFFMPFAARDVGVGAAAGLAFFIWMRLGPGASPRGAALVLALGAAALVCGWFLPGAALAALGLVLGRQARSVTTQGAAAAFLFAYMVYFYYSLDGSLLLKSVLLGSTGLALLGLATAVNRFWDGLAGEFAGSGTDGGVCA